MGNGISLKNEPKMKSVFADRLLNSQIGKNLLDTLSRLRYQFNNQMSTSMGGLHQKGSLRLKNGPEVDVSTYSRKKTTFLTNWINVATTNDPIRRTPLERGNDFFPLSLTRITNRTNFRVLSRQPAFIVDKKPKTTTRKSSVIVETITPWAMRIKRLV